MSPAEPAQKLEQQKETPASRPADEKPAVNNSITPMMAQFLEIKKNHPDALLFYRMGDFYELFFNDAVQAAEALDITLTKRGKHLGEDIPMCGVPVHSHETYLQRLIRSGFKVAVCEQTEDPAEAKKRGSKAVVRRDVVRVVTQGTLTEDTLLDARRHNYLCAVARSQSDLGLAWIDVSTGAFFTQQIAAGNLGAALARIHPGELLLADGLLANDQLAETFRDWIDVTTPLPSARFDSVNGQKRLEGLFGVKTLDSFGDFSRAEIAAAGALVDYIDLTQKGQMPRIARPEQLSAQSAMEIDAATRRNLELTETLNGTVKGSLLSVIDRTITGPGARLLASCLSSPLTDTAIINQRLDGIAWFIDDLDSDARRQGLRERLKGAPDLERALTRLTIGRGGPRDLAAIRDGLALTAVIRDRLINKTESILPEMVDHAIKGLGAHGDLVNLLSTALAPDLPPFTRDGGFIAKGYAPELDELRSLRDESRRLIANLQSDYIAETNITTLKVKHNNVLGYFIEVPAKQAEKIPTGPESKYIHRQTMANAVRYTTVDLSDLEGKIAKAADQALALELEMFDQLAASVVLEADPIAEAAQALARLDLLSSLAELAVTRRYCRPGVNNSTDFAIEGGRHPVVEASLEQLGDGPFVANDCCLNDNSTPEDPENSVNSRLWLLTGPNMAGKSTFLRQNALIAILAQIGSYVPADKATIGVVDRLFSRVGAADDLARGRSTFMVEMVETAAILNQATSKSLVILDEIGRGTATYDGLSIAWAVVEHLHDINACRALFATHYHELTALQSKLDGLSCHTMRVKEWQDDVIFLHEVGAGTADRSYGIHVGQLAGLPALVVERAEQILHSLEQSEESSALTQLADDLPLFAAMAERPKSHTKSGHGDHGPSAAEEELAALCPDDMTPKQALEALYRLKGLFS